MKVFFLGSRNATPKWLPILRLCVQHACFVEPPPLKEWLESDETSRVLAKSRGLVTFSEDWPLWFIHGDGPPGESKEGQRCPIGVDRLSEMAVVLEAPRHARMKRFPVDAPPGVSREEWASAAARRNRAAVAFGPDRSYCLHTDLDSSAGSRMTAGFLRSAGRPLLYVRLTSSGKLVDVEERT